MAFRALLFSKSLEINSALAAACQNAEIHLDLCEDIFAAIDKATKQPFSCVLVDWSAQPEAGFLLKRARESAPNENAVAIAIVEREPSAAEMRDQRLGLLIYRPVGVKEAQEVLAKARETMPEVAVPVISERRKATVRPQTMVAPPPVPPEQPSPDQLPPEDATFHAEAISPPAATPGLEPNPEITPEVEEGEAPSPSHRISLTTVAAVVLVFGALLCLWSARDTILYLASSQGRFNVLKDSVSALFSLNSSGSASAAPTGTDLPVDAYVNRSVGHSDPHLKLGVVSGEAEVADSHIQLHPPSDFPLPAPVYQPPAPQARRAIPDSIRGSAPIAPPVVVTTPSQMMPASAPVILPVSTQQFSEPVAVSEDAARALLIHSVNPSYPPEAASQKLRGPVVLQAIVGRDGSVEDLKIVRGSFVLSKAAIAAVKQWRFQPYTLNGHAAQMQTLLTINFSPQS